MSSAKILILVVAEPEVHIRDGDIHNLSAD